MIAHLTLLTDCYPNTVNKILYFQLLLNLLPNMKTILKALLCICFLSVTLHCFCQNSNEASTLSVDLTALKTDLNDLYLCIYKFQYDSSTTYGLINKLKVSGKKLNTLTTKFKEPTEGYLEIRYKDSVLAYSGTCVLSNEKISVVTKYNQGNRPELLVSSSQTDFKYNNNYIYLKIPYELASNKNYSLDKIKRYYSLNIPEDYKFMLMQQEYERNIINTINADKKFYIALASLYDQRDNFSLEMLEICYGLLKPQFSSSELIRKLGIYISNAKHLFIGSKIPDFFVYKADKSRLEMNSFYEAKDYTLLDFWASWCVPCRTEMKKIRLFYPTLDTAKFSVISVSLDKDPGRWLSASVKDSVEWKNYIDPYGFAGNVAKTFNLTYIPNNILVNGKGEIVALNITGERLEIFLQEKKLYLK